MESNMPNALAPLARARRTWKVPFSDNHLFGHCVLDFDRDGVQVRDGKELWVKAVLGVLADAGIGGAP
jgi:hypothetical protein